MSDDSIKLPSGGNVQITLRRKRRKPASKKARPVPPRGIVPVDDEPPRYLRRGKVEIVYLDLATRLHSVPSTTFTGNRIRLASDTAAPVRDDTYFNEYVEIEYELPRVAAQPATLYTTEEIAQLTAALLGARAPGSSDTLDPLATTEANVTGRKLFNCMPLPERAGLFHLWAGVNDEDYRLSDGTITDTGGIWPVSVVEEWKRRKANAADAQERWNPLNLQFANVAHRTAMLKPRARVERLAQTYQPSAGFGGANVWGMYERFDTSDLTNYKITSEPSFAAAEASISFNTRSAIRIYLVPRMVLHTFTTGVGTPYNFTPFAWHGRMMIYPDVWTGTGATQEEVNRRALCFIQRSPLALSAFNAVTPTVTPVYAVPSFYVFFQEYPNAISLPGMLSAVIVQGAKTFYIWRRTAALINFETDGNIFAGGVSLDTPCT